MKSQDLNIKLAKYLFYRAPLLQCWFIALQYYLKRTLIHFIDTYPHMSQDGK